MDRRVGIYCRVGSKKQLGDYEDEDINLSKYIYQKAEAHEDKSEKIETKCTTK